MDLESYLVDEIRVGRRHSGNNGLAKTPIRVDNRLVIVVRHGVQRESNSSDLACNLFLDDHRDFGVVDRKSVLSFIHHDAVIEAGSKRLRQRLAQPRSRDAKHGFVSPREGGRFEIFFRRGGANGQQSFFAEWFEGVGQCLLLRVVEEEFLRRLFQGIARLHLIVARRPEEIGPRGSRFELPEPWSEEVHRQMKPGGTGRPSFLPMSSEAPFPPTSATGAISGPGNGYIKLDDI